MTKYLTTQVRIESSLVGYPQIRIFLIVLFSIFLSACSDSTKELSGNYCLREEGRDLNDISCHSATGREIPANIISYNFNDDFIIASQRPKMTDDPLYSETHYFNGRDSMYFWLIVHKSKLVLGPLTKSQFDKALSKYNVPMTLDRHPYD